MVTSLAQRTRNLIAGALILSLLQACSREPADPAQTSEQAPVATPEVVAAPEPVVRPPPMDSEIDEKTRIDFANFWNGMLDLCGRAFPGKLIAGDAREAEWRSQPVVLHVPHCSPSTIGMAIHVGEDRSRGWMVSRTAGGLDLRHVISKPDGEPADLSGYGGSADYEGSEGMMTFHADERSQQLFIDAEQSEAAETVWTLELKAGETLTYTMIHPDRQFGVEFSLGNSVQTPPDPWAVAPVM